MHITELKGIGPKLAQTLAKKDIHTVQDLLFHFPYRYQDRTRLTPIANLRLEDYAVIEGTIIKTEVTQRKRRILLCHVQDASGVLALCFFYFTSQQQKYLQPGQHIRCFGSVGYYFSRMTMTHPEYKLMREGESETVASHLTPIYPSIAPLSQARLRHLITLALEVAQENTLFVDTLPAVLREQLDLPDLETALMFIHQPSPEVSMQQLEAWQHPAQVRFIFEELLSQHLGIRVLGEKMQTQQAKPLFGTQALRDRFIENLPFSLTQAQQRVVSEVAQDLGKTAPMQRLLQGDVGSGKTVVAAIGALQAIEAGAQVALMVPTELLAEQHYRHFNRWFSALGLQVIYLAGKQTAAERKAAYAAIATGQAHCVVGTHALFQVGIAFNNLGLIIIDEQHRFGVKQRKALLMKGKQGDDLPHQLIITATPIPRTLYSIYCVNHTVSIIDELPPGRTPIKTAVINNERREEVLERIRHVCGEKRQVYWVCPLIEESDKLQCEAAEKTQQYLQQQLTDVRVGLLHGRLSAVEKEATMYAFTQGELQVLVATTVIEVGVDVPNASLMIIENPERLGLAQLHQLRGRVGRGQIASYCILLYQPPLTDAAKERLQVMRDSHDGFKIAEKDLAIRGPGEILGTRQSGLIRTKVADLQRDNYLFPKVKTAADVLLQNHPEAVKALLHYWQGAKDDYVM